MIKSLLTIIVFAILIPEVHSQTSVTDLQLIGQQDFSKTHKQFYQKRHVTFMMPKSKNLIIRYNPISLGLGVSMYFYQKVISPQFSTQCIYEPSCSNYGRQAIQEFGLVKGLVMTADRLTRCNRIAALDVDRLSLDLKTGRFKDPPSKYRLRPK